MLVFRPILVILSQQKIIIGKGCKQFANNDFPLGQDHKYNHVLIASDL